MQTIEISAEESASGVMRPEHLAAAVRALDEDGFVVLEDAVDPAHIQFLGDKMREDVAAFLNRPNAPFNFNTGNVQQDPPPFPPYLFKDILLNEMAIAVTHAVLGDGVKNDFYSGNTAIRSEQRQPVHADIGHIWKGAAVATPPFGLVVNVPMTDFFPENGSTEIWPGTHKDTRVGLRDDIKIPAEALETWRSRTAPIQPTISAGSLLIRDIRLWHAGMPNRTDNPRTMIAMIHSAGWWQSGAALRFPVGTEDFLKHPVLRTRAEFVEGPIDYISAPHAYDYKPDSK